MHKVCVYWQIMAAVAGTAAYRLGYAISKRCTSECECGVSAGVSYPGYVYPVPLPLKDDDAARACAA